MITFDICCLSPCGTDADTLMTVTWPVLPREGDTVKICGLLRRRDDNLNGEARDEALKEQHTFIVEDVLYDVSKARPDAVTIAIWVRPEAAPWDSTDWAE